jgi:hypothetical protein
VSPVWVSRKAISREKKWRRERNTEVAQVIVAEIQ